MTAFSARDRAPDFPLVTIAPPGIARRHLAAWQGLRVEAVDITRRTPFEYGFKAPAHLLIATERAEREDGETLVEGLPRSTLRNLSRKLSFVPAGHRFQGWQTPRVLSRVTYFYLDPQFPLFDSESAFSEIEFAPRLFFFDEDLWETTRKLKARSEQAQDDDHGYVGALSMVLAHELRRINSGAAQPSKPARGGLAGWQRKRVTDYIEENLALALSLGDLARMVHLSPFHFARAFKRSFGLPPHRFHALRRIEQAKALLEQPGASITEIGLKVGYRETSSFTAAFRKLTGITPSDYRRSAL